jgi:predicted translin family RNA/ssDNA-binding protein
MAELEKVLGEMNRINDRMLVVVRTPDEERNRKIVELRQEFSTETGNLINLLPSEKRLATRPDLFNEFQDRLSNVRRRLASHQMKWTIEDIDTHRGEYLDASRAVHGSIAEYLSWARVSLRPN